jgi:hypothetical protein
MDLKDHPTVRRLADRTGRGDGQRLAAAVQDSAWLRQLARESGADDAGLVEISRPGLALQREEIFRNYPWTNSLLSIVVRMAREPLRGAPRSVDEHRALSDRNELAGRRLLDFGFRNAAGFHLS